MVQCLYWVSPSFLRFSSIVDLSPGLGLVKSLPISPFLRAQLRLFHSVACQRAQWFRTAKNRDVSSGTLARPFACLLAPLTHLLAPHCSLRLRAPRRSFVRSLTHSPPGHGKEVLSMIGNLFISYRFNPSRISPALLPPLLRSTRRPKSESWTPF